MMTIDDVVAVMNSEKAASLCLSKGGWEGWLQCELWYGLNITKKLSVEREKAYPNSTNRCDLVVNPDQAAAQQQWVELKAYGIFREGDVNPFLDGVEVDVHKVDNQRPAGTNGVVFMIVPITINQSFQDSLRQRHGWPGFKAVKGLYATVFYLNL